MGPPPLFLLLLRRRPFTLAPTKISTDSRWRFGGAREESIPPSGFSLRRRRRLVFLDRNLFRLHCGCDDVVVSRESPAGCFPPPYLSSPSPSSLDNQRPSSSSSSSSIACDHLTSQFSASPTYIHNTYEREDHQARQMPENVCK